MTTILSGRQRRVGKRRAKTSTVLDEKFFYGALSGVGLATVVIAGWQMIGHWF